MTTLSTLTEVFRAVFDDPSITLTPQTTADDVEGWDSLSHINLILAVEQRFAVHFSRKEVLRFKNVGDLEAAIANQMDTKTAGG